MMAFSLLLFMDAASGWWKKSCLPVLTILLFSAGLTTAPAAAQQTADEEHVYLLKDEAFIEAAREAIELMYNQQPEASRKRLAPWLADEPEHPLVHFWDGLELWWFILADLENEAFDQAFIRHLELANRSADRMLRKDREHYDALVMKSLSNAFMARMYANRESWYKAFRHGRIAFNVLQNTTREYPAVSADAAFGFGLYSYFTAYLQDEYRVVRAISWMLPAGDRELGLQRLQEAADEGVFVQPEATYFLGHILLHYEEEPGRAETYLLRLRENYPRNSFFNRLLLRTYFRQERADEAAEMNDELISRYQSLADSAESEQMNGSITERARRNAQKSTLEELYTIRGQLFYQEFAYDDAINAFQNVLALRPQLASGADRRHQRITAYQLGRSYIRVGNPEAAIPYFEQLAASETNDGLSELAEAELQRIREP
jgi:hypothetical protein